MFNNEDFVHFHVHSSFSAFDSLNRMDDLCMEARRMGFRSLALTDHGNVMGWQKFLKLCKSKPKDEDLPAIKPILGSEMYLSDKMNIGQYPDNPIYGESGERLKPVDSQPQKRKGNRHLNLYAMNHEGYKNLCVLSEKSWTEGFYSDPRIDLDLLQRHANGLMIGSACLASVINQNLLLGNYEEAKRYGGIFKEISNNNFFLEVMYHGIPEEKYIIPDIFKLSVDLDVPVLVTGDVHYLYKHQARSQEVLMAMNTSKCIKDPSRMNFSFDEFYLKSADEISKGFRTVPQVVTNTVAMAERIDTDDIERHLFGGMRLPRFPLPEGYSDPYTYLCELAWSGLKKHGFDKSEKHIQSLKKELDDIRVAQENNGYDFSTYFLIVRDYIKAAKSNGVLVGPGRGSGYASILLRCIDITYGEDPIRHGLLWERFLGFDDMRFISERDFGFSVEGIDIESDDEDVLEEAREYEEDMGGVDRY